MGHSITPQLRIISWNLTIRCPLKCPHCYSDAGTRDVSDPLSTTEAFGILDQIKATGNPVVILSGGEPMMQDLPEAKSLVASMKGGCSAGIGVANVTDTGDLYPCQFAQIPEFRIGSIREQSFSKLWNDPENPVLKMFREKKEFLTGKRRSCSYLDLCGGGCRVRAYWQSGEFYAGDPFCFIEKWTPHSPFSRRM